MPWKTPYLLSGFIQTELTLISKILNAGSARHTKSSQNGQVLHVLGDRERTSLQNKNAVAVGRVLGKEMLGKDSAERASSDDDHIEGSGIRAVRRICTGDGFVKTVADVTSKNVL